MAQSILGKTADGKFVFIQADCEGRVVTQPTGNRVEEVLTQDNASLDNVLTFEEPIQSIEIWHNEDDPKEFIVNGITLVIASGGWRSPVGGTPSNEVTIPAGITCIVKRLV